MIHIHRSILHTEQGWRYHGRMRTKRNAVRTGEEKETLRIFWAAAEAADRKDKGLSFLKGVLTESEQMLFGRRIRIAQMLLRGATRFEIIEVLHVSPNTITKVNQWLAGQMPEYEEVLRKTVCDARTRATKRKRPTPWYRRESVLPFARLRRRYPLHFLLFNIADELLVQRRRAQQDKR